MLFRSHGGYQILKDLHKVTLYDLAQMIEGPIQIVNCFHGNYSHCDMTSSCNVISPMLNLNERIAGLFTTITVRDLIDSKNQGEKYIRSKPVAKEEKSSV